jgi:hypothetical protein
MVHVGAWCRRILAPRVASLIVLTIVTQTESVASISSTRNYHVESSSNDDAEQLDVDAFMRSVTIYFGIHICMAPELAVPVWIWICCAMFIIVATVQLVQGPVATKTSYSSGCARERG